MKVCKYAVGVKLVLSFVFVFLYSLSTFSQLNYKFTSNLSVARSNGSANKQARPVLESHSQTVKNVHGKEIKSRQFLSCNDWLYIPDEPSFIDLGDLDIPGDQVTVEATINRITPYTRGDLYAGDIVSKHLDPTNANYLLRPGSAEITTSNGYYKTPTVCGLELNKTYHVAMVYDGNTLKFYRNGFLMSQVRASGNLFQNDLPARLGLFTGAPDNEGFIGYINEVRIWKVARSQIDIRAYMGSSLPSPATQPGLMAYYVFDNLKNKQGNPVWDGKLSGNAAINRTNPTCNNFAADSCGTVRCKIESVAVTDSILTCRTVKFTSKANVNGIAVNNLQWIFGDGTRTGGNNVIHSYNNAGNYTVKLFATSDAGCNDSTQISITIEDVHADAGRDTLICKNAPVTLGGRTKGTSYAWSPGKYLNDSTLQTPLAVIKDPTRFSLVVKGGQGCIDTGSVLISVRPKVIFSAAYDSSVCKGDKTMLNVTNGDEFSWSPATYLNSTTTSNPVCAPDQSVKYTVYVKEHTCNNDTTLYLNIAVSPNPLVAAQKSNDINCSVATSQLTATGAIKYLWSPSVGLSDSAIYNPVASINASTTFSVKGIDANGCFSYDTVMISATKDGMTNFELPNAFTPNGDGHNDCFGLKNIGAVSHLQFSIFNRWGERIFFTSNPQDCWDGRYHGKMQDSGVFVYLIKVQTLCGEIFRKGTVILLL